MADPIPFPPISTAAGVPPQQPAPSAVTEPPGQVTDPPGKVNASPSGGDDTSVEARLAKLDSLKEKGLISEEEYAIKRKKMIDEL